MVLGADLAIKGTGSTAIASLTTVKALYTLAEKSTRFLSSRKEKDERLFLSSEQNHHGQDTGILRTMSPITERSREGLERGCKDIEPHFLNESRVVDDGCAFMQVANGAAGSGF